MALDFDRKVYLVTQVLSDNYPLNQSLFDFTARLFLQDTLVLSTLKSLLQKFLDRQTQVLVTANDDAKANIDKATADVASLTEFLIELEPPVVVTPPVVDPPVVTEVL
jgi:hypothetical protein